MRILDLFCCEGGAGAGYAAAGFEVVGVDVNDQPLYPFEFHQADAIDVLTEAVVDGSRGFHWQLGYFDAVHGSPPCQDHSTLSAPFADRMHGTGWMLQATLDGMAALGVPYVVENVMGAKRSMPNAFTLCARSFGIDRLRRHRLFVSNVAMLVPPCACDGQQPLGIYGDISKNDRKVRNSKDGGIRMRAGVQSAKDMLGCQWMSPKGLTQAIPPAYTEFIGRELLAHIGEAAA